MASLSKVTPDFEDLFKKLQSRLESSPTWTDLLPTSVGTTFLDLFAASSVTNQYYLDIAFREAFLSMAFRDSSIYAGTRFLGVRIARKVSAGCTARVENASTQVVYIPPYSQFLIGGKPFYTKAQYVIPAESYITNMDLYSGEVKTLSFDLSIYSDLRLKEFLLNLPDFSVTDLLVYTQNPSSTNTRIWESTDKPLFEHTPDDSVFYENTTRDGDVSLTFGDGIFGRLLSNEDTLYIRCVVTNGSADNNGLPGLQVQLLDNSDITGLTITAIAGGADQKSSSYYKLFAPQMRRTDRRAISLSDIRAALMLYPGIADAVVQGQKDIAPNDLRWMDVIRICVLPEEIDTLGGANPNPKSAAWSQLSSWLSERIAGFDIQTWNPKKLFVKLHLKIGIYPSADPSIVKVQALEKVLGLFVKKPGILGRMLVHDDISEAVSSVQGIDYIRVLSPVDQIVPGVLEYVVLDGIPTIDVVYSERTLSLNRGAF